MLILTANYSNPYYKSNPILYPNPKPSPKPNSLSLEIYTHLSNFQQSKMSCFKPTNYSWSINILLPLFHLPLSGSKYQASSESPTCRSGGSLVIGMLKLTGIVMRGFRPLSVRYTFSSIMPTTSKATRSTPIQKRFILNLLCVKLVNFDKFDHIN